jgi:hypothetical protein
MAEDPSEQGAPPAPREDEVTVWAVRLGTADEGVRGTLRLSGDEVTFDSDRGSVSLRIPLAEIRSARSVMGSPVIVLHHRRGKQRRHTAFYFVQPPPLPPRPGEEPAELRPPPPSPFPGVGRFMTRRKARFVGIARLASWNQLKRSEVKAWAKRIREAAASARKSDRRTG